MRGDFKISPKPKVWKMSNPTFFMYLGASPYFHPSKGQPKTREKSLKKPALRLGRRCVGSLKLIEVKKGASLLKLFLQKVCAFLEKDFEKYVVCLFGNLLSLRITSSKKKKKIF